MFQLALLAFHGAVTFSCSNLTLTDDSRQGALSFINQLRSQVALGAYEAKNLFLSASDMTKLPGKSTKAKTIHSIIHLTEKKFNKFCESSQIPSFSDTPTE
ncbi:hypothetical protein KIN20_015079 [Parelaphostrongylus tenuis]|uniref:Uncharacterized protein n=1 Tax=Parelaphostrongylus tenuis TaxID=148309 RepID=A0AAD5QPQ2_PARTN|nr:hypothetical protein KIN20_015079 [Parelaphostrongylus tenuis]